MYTVDMASYWKVLMLSLFWTASATFVPAGASTTGKTQPRPAYGKPLADTLALEGAAQLKAQKAQFAPVPLSTQSAVAPQSPQSSFDQQAPQSPADQQAPQVSGEPEPEPTAQNPNQDSTAAAPTMAPFHRANNSFAPLRSIQLPRPLNIPKDASPALKEAAAMIANMSVVSGNLIRGAQPSTQALVALKTAGVKTIINLRNEPILVAQEARAAKGAGLDYINIPMALFDTPTKQQFQKFLNAVDNNGPVFVHCQMGEDRTGTMVAVYRLAREGWDANRAYQEMTSMGFKTFLGSLRGAVFDYSASLGRPARRPMPDLSGFTSILHH